MASHRASRLLEPFARRLRVSDRAPARWIPVSRRAAAEFSSPAEAEPAFRANAPHLEGMNEQQISAIVAPIAPMKVLAGPGSGKTRVLVGRVTHLINELGVPPSHILCITFTNKAAREMRERLIASVGEDNARRITAGTFHSVASRMLRKHVHLLDGYGRGNDFVIYDEADTKSIIRKILVDVFMEDKKKVDPSLAKSRVSAAKSAVDACVGMDGRRMMRALCDTRPNLKRDPYTRDQFPRLYDEYEANLRSSNALDFDDLLSAAVALLRTSEEARMFYTQKWRHVLVDEFQDTSLSQYELIRTLAAESARVFVVGDVDQAIYSWRGAEVANIRTKFDSDFAGAGTVLLTKNYRSTATIVKAAQAVIGESRDRSPLELDAVQPGGKDVAVVATEDEVDEADFAAREAARAARNGVPLKDIAVLYRTHSQSRPLEEAFIRAGVPHVVVGDTAFYTRKEIKDLVAYLRVLFNSRDTVSLQRIINTPPRKIGPGTMQKLETWAASLPWIDGMPQPLGMALLDRTWSSPDQEDILPSAVDMGLGAAAYKAVSGFVSVMRDLGESMEVSDPGALTEELVRKIGFEDYVADMENGDERVGYIKELVSIASDPSAVESLDSDGAVVNPATKTKATGHEGLGEFLEGISLLMSAETRSEDEGADAVKLMTLHAAKGLEFDTVMITGCEDELIPFKRGDGDAAEHDEEVRLFYVGLTRAKRKLFLCRAFKRMRFGRTVYADPSPFLEVIRESLVGGKPAQARRAGMGVNSTENENDEASDAEAPALGDNSLAQHLRRATGAKVGMGSSPAFSKYAKGETGGYAKANAWKKRMNAAAEGGSGRANSSREVMGSDDPEASARRAARRASAASKQAPRATKARATGGAGAAGVPRAAPRRNRGKVE